MAIWRQDPTEKIESAFRRIERDCFADIDFCNRALEVAAVGFALREHGWSGIVITPWFLNLMILPGTEDWERLPVGQRRRIELPAGRFEVRGGEDEQLGEYLYCPMISSMSVFANQAEAVEVAKELVRLLGDQRTAESLRRMNPTGLLWNAPPAATPIEFHAGRRDFLRGRLLGPKCVSS